MLKRGPDHRERAGKQRWWGEASPFAEASGTRFIDKQYPQRRTNNIHEGDAYETMAMLPVLGMSDVNAETFGKATKRMLVVARPPRDIGMKVLLVLRSFGISI